MVTGSAEPVGLQMVVQTGLVLRGAARLRAGLGARGCAVKLEQVVGGGDQLPFGPDGR